MERTDGAGAVVVEILLQRPRGGVPERRAARLVGVGQALFSIRFWRLASRGLLTPAPPKGDAPRPKRFAFHDEMLAKPTHYTAHRPKRLLKLDI